MKTLKLSIKPRREPSEDQLLNSSGYSIKINDWELGRGVTDFKLEMSASKKPKATITFTPSVIDVDEMMAVVGLQTSMSELDEQNAVIFIENWGLSDQELKDKIFAANHQMSLFEVQLQLYGEIQTRNEATKKADPWQSQTLRY